MSDLLSIDEIRKLIDTAKQDEKNNKGAGNRCGKCHRKKGEKPPNVPKSMWTPHQCDTDLLNHPWEKCPTKFKDGKSTTTWLTMQLFYLSPLRSSGYC